MKPKWVQKRQTHMSGFEVYLAESDWSTWIMI